MFFANSAEDIPNTQVHIISLLFKHLLDIHLLTCNLVLNYLQIRCILMTYMPERILCIINFNLCMRKQDHTQECKGKKGYNQIRSSQFLSSFIFLTK